MMTASALTSQSTDSSEPDVFTPVINFTVEEEEEICYEIKTTQHASTAAQKCPKASVQLNDVCHIDNDIIYHNGKKPFINRTLPFPGDICLLEDEHVRQDKSQCAVRLPVPWICKLIGGDASCTVCLRSIYVWSCKGVLIFTLLAFRGGTLLGINMGVTDKIEKDPLFRRSETGIVTVILLGEFIFGSLCSYWLFLILLIQLNGGSLSLKEDILHPMSQLVRLLTSYGAQGFVLVMTAHIRAFDNIHHVIFPRISTTEQCGCDSDDLRQPIKVVDNLATSKTITTSGYEY